MMVYDVVKRVLMTEKSAALFQKEGKITLEVAKGVNKLVIKDAVEKIWDVKVAKVAVMNTPAKVKSFGRRPYVRHGKKKAVITLKKGYKIDLSGQFEGAGVAAAGEAGSETGGE